MTKTNYSEAHLTCFKLNPYIVLGLSCCATKQDISDKYEKLLKLAKLDSLSTYEFEYKLPQIKAIDYDEAIINTAHSELSKISHKVFAFDDKEFLNTITIDECTERLDNINCYDCFLSCYLWLLTNDTDFTYKDLWSRVCNYIDDVIDSTRLQWSNYFDNRFSIDEINDNFNCYEDFYNAFKENILLPIKNIERNSSDCNSAREILFNAISQTKSSPNVIESATSNELIKLAKQVQNSIEDNTKENEDTSSLLTLQEEEEESYGNISLVDSIEELTSSYSNVIKSGNIQNKESFDSIDTSKASAFNLTTPNNNKQNIKMDSIDSDKSTSPTNQNNTSPSSVPVSEEILSKIINNEFETQQQKQMNKKHRNCVLSLIIKILILAGLIGAFFYFKKLYNF